MNFDELAPEIFARLHKGKVEPEVAVPTYAGLVKDSGAIFRQSVFDILDAMIATPTKIKQKLKDAELECVKQVNCNFGPTVPLHAVNEEVVYDHQKCSYVPLLLWRIRWDYEFALGICLKIVSLTRRPSVLPYRRAMKWGNWVCTVRPRCDGLCVSRCWERMSKDTRIVVGAAALEFTAQKLQNIREHMKQDRHHFSELCEQKRNVCFEFATHLETTVLLIKKAYESYYGSAQEFCALAPPNVVHPLVFATYLSQYLIENYRVCPDCVSVFYSCKEHFSEEYRTFEYY